MTDPWEAIKNAHDALHADNVEEAHEALHAAGAGGAEWPPIACGTHSAEAQKAVQEFVEQMKRDLPCGHTLGDLTWAPGSVTKCGACVAERQAARENASGT